MHLLTRKTFFFFCCLLLIAVFLAAAVSADPVVVANSKSWKDIYLTAVYARFIDADFYYIQGLSDAELKTSLISKSDQVQIFESIQQPVVKNYRSFLSINGFDDIAEFRFLDEYELQEYLYDDLSPDGVLLLGNDFGMEAIAGVPYAIEKNYFPFFYSDDSYRYLYRLSRRDDVVAVGRVPYRVVERLRPEEIFIGNPALTTLGMMRLAAGELRDAEWGVITRIDEIDFENVRDLPIIVYFSDEYVEEIGDIMAASSVRNYEVIGGNTADIASALESESGRDLNLLLKFGRKITNYRGLEDTILNVDTLSLPFPYENLELLDVSYYPNMDILTMTYRNQGNVGAYVFSNVDYAGTVVSDDQSHQILAGETKTVSYNFTLLSPPDEGERAVITTRYGLSFPLQKNLQGPTGLPFVQRNVTVDLYAEAIPLLSFKEAALDTATGILELKYSNPGNTELRYYAEFSLGEEIITSPIQTIASGDTDTLVIDFAYVPNRVLVGRTFNLTTFYGQRDTYFYAVDSIEIVEKKDYTWYYVTAAIIVLLALLLFFFLRWRASRVVHFVQSTTHQVNKASKKPVKSSGKKSASSRPAVKRSVVKKTPAKKTISRKKTSSRR